MTTLSGKQYDFVKIMAPVRIETITVNAIQRAFEGNRLAYASTIVFVLFLSIVVVTVIQILLVKRLEVEY